MEYFSKLVVSFSVIDNKESDMMKILMITCCVIFLIMIRLLSLANVV